MTGSAAAAHRPMAPNPPPAHRGRSSAARTAWILLASVLCGAGLFLLWSFITFFVWIDLIGLLLVGLGSVVFFLTLTGPDSADPA
ncbi:MAG: hypothetical protein QXG65_01025 [Thermoplasmata archaeon]